jgi:Rieske Fe-S protein
MTRTIPAVDGKLELPLVRFPELQQTGGVLRVRPGPTADPLLVLTLGAERYVALSTVCTHLGCAVEARGAQLICPCHGSTYDREGRVLQGPAERPLTRYATQLLPDGILRVDLGRLA